MKLTYIDVISAIRSLCTLWQRLTLWVTRASGMKKVLSSTVYKFAQVAIDLLKLIDL